MNIKKKKKTYHWNATYTWSLADEVCAIPQKGPLLNWKCRISSSMQRCIVVGKQTCRQVIKSSSGGAGMCEVNKL